MTAIVWRGFSHRLTSKKLGFSVGATIFEIRTLIAAARCLNAEGAWLTPACRNDEGRCQPVQRFIHRGRNLCLEGLEGMTGLTRYPTPRR